MKMIPNGDEMLVCYRILEFTLILIHWKWTKKQTTNPNRMQRDSARTSAKV